MNDTVVIDDNSTIAVTPAGTLQDNNNTTTDIPAVVDVPAVVNAAVSSALGAAEGTE